MTCCVERKFLKSGGCFLAWAISCVIFTLCSFFEKKSPIVLTWQAKFCKNSCALEI